MPALVWSDALFLSALDHCKDQKATPADTVSALGEFQKDGDSIIGASTPQSRAEKYAVATGVELNVQVAKSPSDALIAAFLDPESRQMMFDPLANYYSVSTCPHTAAPGEGLFLTVSNYARAVILNEAGKDKIQEMLTKPVSDVVDTVIDKAKDAATA